MQTTDRYNSDKHYDISYKGQHYVIQQFVKGYKVSNKLRLGLTKIAEITGLSKNHIKGALR